jgi:hypothetical protein
MIIAVNKVYNLLDAKGKDFTYKKVQRALSGRPDTTSDEEKKQLLSIIEKEFKAIKQNILKS